MLRGLVLSATLIDFGLVAVRIVTHPGVSTMPGFAVTVGLLVVSLASTAIITAASIYVNLLPGNRRFAMAAGAGSGLILIAHMALENFGAHVGQDSRLTAAVMFATFALWSSSGWQTAGSHSSPMAGAVAGCLTALVSVMLAVTFAFIGMYFDIPPANYVATWPEYIQSGSTDPAAFAIENTLAAATSHIATALILGTIVGGLGGVAASQRKSTLLR